MPASALLPNDTPEKAALRELRLAWWDLTVRILNNRPLTGVPPFRRGRARCGVCRFYQWCRDHG
jgi:hypothetical protein